MSTDRLRHSAETAAIRALSDQDRDPSSPTCGCFDRRFWAWKLVDFPEATFQRHVYPLAMLAQDPASRLYKRADVLDAIQSGLRFAISIQHRNGSFDQAFPFEQSWGATAFLLQPLLAAFELVRADLGGDAAHIAMRLSASAEFLRNRRERHGTITNHLAGGAHALYEAARVLKDARARDAADALVADIVASQSPEGWFPEYGGADPGYQTLCLHYLAEILRVAPEPALAAAIGRGLEFVQWFVHPNGTLGGVYGSRRTRVAYPGGFALLAGDFPIAAAIAAALASAAADEAGVTVQTVDAGNLAPLLTSLVRSLTAPPGNGAAAVLPRDRESASVDFADAGLHVRSTPRYYAIVGSGNGGTLTAFDRSTGARLTEDGGYTGLLDDGRVVTSQVTAKHLVTATPESVTVEAVFAEMPRRVPTPAQFLILRILNLTVMRSLAIGNAIKRALVARLIAPQARVPISVDRQFTFGDRIDVRDRFRNDTGLAIRRMRGGVPLCSVHMASAGYYEGASLSMPADTPVEIDAAVLTRARTLERSARL